MMAINLSWQLQPKQQYDSPSFIALGLWSSSHGLKARMLVTAVRTIYGPLLKFIANFGGSSGPVGLSTLSRNSLTDVL